jgi:hypothetical protein
MNLLLDSEESLAGKTMHLYGKASGDNRIKAE